MLPYYKLTGVLFKSIATIAVALTVCFSVHAQDGGAKNVQQGKAGASIVFDMGSGNLLGLGGKLHYNVAKNLRLSTSLTQYFGAVSIMGVSVKYFERDFSLNGQYLFHIGDVQLKEKASMYLYPMVGMGFVKTKTKVKSTFLPSTEEEKYNSKGKGMNIGGGFEIAAKENMSAFVEIKHSFVGDLSRTSFTVGISYYF